ncbi:MAG: FAD-dependent oxidoreductase [Chloroflexota bacterium]|nr:FAD-dependent oxidoreductase [Chloroflexota bacterium]MDE3102511.1 FAD-dependent oxidoreductase [Chloroflexota bacterium]
MPAFDRVADVVVLGAGAAGLPAAIAARDAGASVLVLEANHDIGGHAMLSGGNVRLGGGTSWQRRYGVEDSPDLVFLELTDPHHPQFRRNDREIVRAFADESVPTFDFLVENGVAFQEQPPVFGRFGTIPRVYHTPPSSKDFADSINGSGGSGLMRDLERSARRKGASILLRHRFVKLVRESGRVVGVVAETRGAAVRIGARRGVVIATGGHSSNVAFRRMFDARLTEEYQVAGEPWTQQNADGELAALAIGAALWGVGIQANDSERSIGGGTTLVRPGFIGCRYGYHGTYWDVRSPMFAKAGASGLAVSDLQDVILVDQEGKRFHDELDTSVEFLSACLGPHGNLGHDERPVNGGGPIWAIFDTAAALRERWTTQPPHVDPDGWFFTADTIGDLARAIRNPYQRRPIRPRTLEETVDRYNEIVDLGTDPDFGRPAPLGGQRIAALRGYKIERPPFFAAWSTPIVHDSLSGLRIDTHARVLGWNGNVLPGLFCAGESAGGFGLHGLSRAIVFGRIAGATAAALPEAPELADGAAVLDLHVGEPS